MSSLTDDDLRYYQHQGRTKAIQLMAIELLALRQAQGRRVVLAEGQKSGHPEGFQAGGETENEELNGRASSLLLRCLYLLDLPPGEFRLVLELIEEPPTRLEETT